jgi:uncharacterized protein YjbI with pentapeptide repeats
MQKADMSKSQYVKKPICQKADNQKADLSKSRYFADIFPLEQQADMQKADMQKADGQKADLSKSRSVKKPIFCPNGAENVDERQQLT